MGTSAPAKRGSGSIVTVSIWSGGWEDPNDYRGRVDVTADGDVSRCRCTPKALTTIG